MAIGYSTAPDEVLKNTLGNYAFEHYEIASYKSLLSLADVVGRATDTSVLKQALGEEESMAAWIAEHITPTTLRYVERTVAGQKAGI